MTVQFWGGNEKCVLFTVGAHLPSTCT